jgi:transcriptional regulator with XRE-family HTH domain
MLIHKLRLQRGWSQQQLAELSGLSTRTVQRIEGGHAASTESLKSLAAVFEIDFAQLNPESMMHTTLEPPTQSRVNAEEILAFRQVRKLRGFYVHAMQYALIVPTLAVVNLLTSPHYFWFLWVAFGWGIGLMSHAMAVFHFLPFLGADWEKREVEKRLGRPL